MDALRDFEDMLFVLEKHRVRYLIIGGLAFIYHAKPRYTKDMDLWIDPDAENVNRANGALQEFGSPALMNPNNPGEVLQLGVAPDRIDLIRQVGRFDFDSAWSTRISSRFGDARANWIDLNTLLEMKDSLPEPRHQEDARVLRDVLDIRRKANDGQEDQGD